VLHVSLQTDVVPSPTWTDKPQELESRLADLQCRYDQLVAKNNATMSQLEAEVQALQQQVRQQAEELAWIRSSGNAVVGTSTVSELLIRLRSEHEALLQRQLDDIRNECLRICSSHAVNCAASEPVNSAQSQLSDDDELTDSCQAVVDRSHSVVSYEAVSEAEDCCTTDVACSLTAESDSLRDISQKRRLSHSFDLECTSADGLLAKSAKLF